jgi:hypothetical protein
MEFMSCDVYHLGFLIDTKTHTFCKGPSEEHSSYDFCQMFKKEKKKKEVFPVVIDYLCKQEPFLNQLVVTSYKWHHLEDCLYTINL